tara:strand:- start:722 stop:1711 length:990 start_codon:yes stop_codon:yes gene_type:complete
MAIPRKPIPKTQKQISIDQQQPSDARYGNPNIPVPTQFNETGIDFNRSTKLSWKDDTNKPFSIGIKDIDEAVFYYFQNVIKPFVYQNGERRNVPIIYAAPERWKSFQRDGYYRDKKGAIMLPIMVVKRDTITKDRSVYNKLDANDPNLYASFQRAFNPKNFYSNFAVINNKIPSKQMYAVAVPDFLTIEYSVLIQTYYMEQLNKIIEACEYASDAYWGNPERFKFRSFIDSFSTETSLTVGKDRLVKGTFNIRLRGYIIPDTIQKDMTAINKYNTKSKFIVTMETTSNKEIFEEGVVKTRDGRTRRQREDIGEVGDISDVTRGTELKNK